MSGVKKIHIAEGVSLNFIDDKKYKTVSVSMFLSRKLSRSEVTKNSLLSSVLAQGTQNLPTAKDIDRYLKSLYGAAYSVSVQKKGDVQSIAFEFSSLNEKYSEKGIIKKCFDMMFEFIFNPLTENGGFLKKYVDTEKANLETDIRALINDKREYADFRCVEEMCAGESAAIREIGYIEDLEEINEKNLYEHYKKIITSSPIDIFVVGDVDIDETVAYLKNAFDGVKLDISPVKIEIDKKNAGEIKYVDESLDVTQGKLSIGLRTGISPLDKDYWALVVGNSVFGSGAHSKLFNNVREKLSLAYYAYSRISRYNSIMLIGSGIEFENFKKAKKEIFFQLESVKKGDFTENDLFVAKQFIINRYKSYSDSPALLKDYYFGNILLGYDVSVDEAIKKVEEVTTEDIIYAFCKISTDTVYFLKGRE
ncbi:MAG: pitrilysin family protein [Clostridia bacterium]|nr:insulinase family protein [Oscillospiraceae bacterium]MDY5627136.1 pitrilysin family protein [Clostridia bacterium]